ncbi:MAG: hypothetical protein Q9165_008784 [Trypethelium subeluteriae]
MAVAHDHTSLGSPADLSTHGHGVFCTDCIWNGYKVATQYALSLQHQNWLLSTNYGQLQDQIHEHQAFQAGLSDRLFDAENTIKQDRKNVVSLERRLAHAYKRIQKASYALEDASEERLQPGSLQYLRELLQDDNTNTGQPPLQLEVVPLAGDPKRVRHQYVQPQVDTRQPDESAEPDSELSEALATSGV